MFAIFQLFNTIRTTTRFPTQRTPLICIRRHCINKLGFATGVSTSYNGEKTTKKLKSQRRTRRARCRHWHFRSQLVLLIVSLEQICFGRLFSSLIPNGRFESSLSCFAYPRPSFSSRINYTWISGKTFREKHSAGRRSNRVCRLVEK